MKRKVAMLLMLMLVFCVCGCKQQREEKTESVPDIYTDAPISINDTEEVKEQKTDATKEEQKEKEEETEENQIIVEYDVFTDQRYNENDKMILDLYYSMPVVTIEKNEEAQQEIAAAFHSDKEDFLINGDELEQEAILVFEDAPDEDMPAYSSRISYTQERMDGNVISFYQSKYLHNGGIHGNTYVSGWNFDAKTGKRLSLNDITDNYDAFISCARDYILEQCESEAYQEILFPDYKDTIEMILQDDLWFLDREGITFISNTYEMASYAEGTLFFTIPYSALAGLKSDYAYEGGFMRSVNLGDGISVDLDGDGTEDEVLFDVQESSDYTYVPKLIINSVDYSSVFEDNQCYFAYPYEKYVIIDIDSADESLEIAVQDYGMSDDPKTAVLKYNSSGVIFMGEVRDRVSDLNIVSDGSGKLYARELLSIFETMRMQSIYEVENDKLVLNMDALHEIVYGGNDGTKTLLRDMIVYKSMSLEGETVTLPKKSQIKVLATDNNEWVQIEYADGNLYYIHVVDYFMIDMDGEKVNASEVLDFMFYAG